METKLLKFWKFLLTLIQVPIFVGEISKEVTSYLLWRIDHLKGQTIVTNYPKTPKSSFWTLILKAKTSTNHFHNGIYTNDYKMFSVLQILDLVPKLTYLYFCRKLPVTLSYAQASILLCIGLQNQDISYIEVYLFIYFFWSSIL